MLFGDNHFDKNLLRKFVGWMARVSACHFKDQSLYSGDSDEKIEEVVGVTIDITMIAAEA